jgi:hypothetical protein
LAGGKFLTSQIVRDPDFKYQRRSDPIWFSNPLYSFQGLDSTLPSLDWILEAHFVHHDNGAILNKIPFMKKTRIGLMAGAGAAVMQKILGDERASAELGVMMKQMQSGKDDRGTTFRPGGGVREDQLPENK